MHRDSRAIYMKLNLENVSGVLHLRKDEQRSGSRANLSMKAIEM